MHISIHIQFQPPFHYHTMCVERQNVVAKSNILTMLKNLKPRTISFSTRGMLIPIFWQFVEGLAIIDVVRAKKQHMIVSWVCLKWSLYLFFFGAFDEKDHLSNCDSWCSDLFLINSIVHGSLRIDIKTTFSVWKRVDCQHFTTLYVYFRSPSHSSSFRKFHRNRKYDPTNMF